MHDGWSKQDGGNFNGHFKAQRFFIKRIIWKLNTTVTRYTVFSFCGIFFLIICRALNARCMVNWLLHLKNIWVERGLLSAEYHHWEKASGTDNLCFSNLFLTKNMNSMIILYSGPVINWDNPMAIKNLRIPLAKIVLKRLSGQKKMIDVYVWARGVCVWAKRISTRNNEVIVWIVYEGLRRMCSYLQCTYMKI